MSHAHAHDHDSVPRIPLIGAGALVVDLDGDGGTVTFSVAPGAGLDVLLYREVSRER
jgi:hypothetical protein